MSRRSSNWLGVELRHLAALTAVADRRSFGRAAEQLGITQSAVSQQIAALERLVGQRLIERRGGTRGATLTESGSLLYAHAETIIARFVAAEAELRSAARGVRTLRIGVFPSVGARILPWLIRDFVRIWPDVELRLSESPNDARLLALVERGALDLTFAQLPLDDSVFETAELLRDPYVLLVAADAAPSFDEPPTFEQVAGLRLIGYTHCRTLHHIETQLRTRGLEPQIIYRSDNCGTIQGLVASGVANALVPRLVAEPLEPNVRMLRLADDVPPRVIGIAWRRGDELSPPARAFADVALRLCADRWVPEDIPIRQTVVREGTFFGPFP